MTAFEPSRLAFVPFVSVANMMRLIHRIGISEILSGMEAYIEEYFRRWELFDTTPRVASHCGGHRTTANVGWGRLWLQILNGYPKNTAEGVQTVTAFGLLADVPTGYPVLLSEMTELTALRTAATSALVTKYLAPEGADTMIQSGSRRVCRRP
ncbi:hypothetical protein [Antarctobacter sp.]|uniref:hypothetical protein n=1 Tax=Antarctobacter sp. TaxID=1872577 RepID=UPI002B277E8D|nr:hypothetical protein [Antarctobacter sp.]